jgi:hypothetical protein
MSTTNDKSLTKAADSLSVFIGSTLDTSKGSVAFAGLQEDKRMDAPNTRGGVATSDNGNIIGLNDRYVASLTPTGSTPTNWFELAADLCHSGHITETRMRRAVDAVRKAVSQ